VPIWRKPEDRVAVREFVDRVKEALGERVRLHVDDRDQYSPGWKYNEYEMRGVPIRLEIGPKDVANQSVMTVRRDTRAKEPVPLAALAERVPAMLAEIQASLYQQALEFREANTVLDSRARVHGSVTLAAPAQLFRGVQVTVDGTVTGDDHRPSQLLGRGRSRQLRAADRRGASQGGGARPGSRRGVPGRAAGATC